MKVKIWGARGSIPAPITPQAVRDKLIEVLQGAQGVDLEDPQAIREYLDRLNPVLAGTAGGNTACVEIQADGKIIIIDAGSGIRALGRELMKGPLGRGQGELFLFLSHLHWDHIQGLPFFTPLYVPGNRVHIIGIHDYEGYLKSQMTPPYFPVTYEEMKADIKYRRIQEEEAIQIGKVCVKNLKLPHPGDAYGFRFEFNDAVVVYASDAEYKKMDEVSIRPYIEFFSRADVLFFDAQFSLRDALVKYEDWGHSSALIGADMARKAKAKRLVLFHHDPVTTDQELVDIWQQAITYQQTTRGSSSCEIIIGQEGLTFDLEPVKVFALEWGQNHESVVLQVSNEFDQNHVAEVLSQIGQNAAIQLGGARLPRLVVDLSSVTQLNISGLRALIDLRRHWEGRPMALAALSPDNYKVIELANFLDLFAIYSTVAAAQSALEAGDTLRLKGQLLSDRYQIEVMLGESDLSTVFKATDTRLDRPVAIKVLSPTLGQSAVKRLLGKARQMARLQAPNVVTIYDWAEDQGLAYLVMEYIEGQTLRDLIVKGQVFQPMEIAIEILYALEYAHNKGAVDGNLKPENVMLSDELKLIDFGLWWADEGQRLTDLPFLLGDAFYLAPEQIEGKPIDTRTDLYAFGLILYELFTGRKPFLGEIRYVLEKHLYQKPVPPRQLNPNISRSLEHLILKLLAKDPAQRYETASQVRQILLGLEVAPEYKTGARYFGFPSAAEGDRRAHLTPSGTGRRQVLVEREDELEQLLRVWDLAQIGRGQMVLIAGEPGVGKSYLVEQFASQLEGALTLMGQCGEMEGSAPYQPFIEIVHDFIARQTPREAAEYLGEDAAVLATIVPQIKETIPNLSTLPPLEPEQERSRLMRSFTDFVKRAALVQPWLMIIDNLQWIDPASMRMLFYLFRNISSASVLIVGIYRDVELGNNHPLKKFDQEMERYPNYQKLSLNRLSLEGVAQLLQATWNTEVPNEWVDAIYHRTGGNPFYVKEVVKGLMEDNIVMYRDGNWQFRPIGEVKLPKSVRDIVMRRLNRFNLKTQELIRRAAILGQQFSLNDLLGISEFSEEEFFESLDEAMERNVLREVDGGTMLTFSHADVQQVIYEELPLHRRKLLHRQIGTMLENRHAENLEPIAGQLANHFLQAGEVEKAIHYSLIAARHAFNIYAYQSALHWYRQAEKLLPESQASAESYIELYAGLGAVLRIQARYTESSQAYNAMYEVAQGSNGLTAQSRALCGLAQIQDDLGDHSAALELARRAVVTAQQSGDRYEVAKALVVSGWMQYKTGDLAAAESVAEEALELSHALDARAEIAQSLNLMGVVNDAQGNFAKAITYFQKALDLYKNMDNRNQVGYMLNNLGESARQRGDYQKAVRYYQDALSIAKEIGDRDGEITFLSNLGAAKVGLGEYAAAETDLRQVIETLEATGWGGLGETYYYLALANLKQSKINEALAAAEKALALGQEREQLPFIGAAWRVLGMISAQSGQPITLGERRYTGRLMGGDTGKLLRSRYSGEFRHYSAEECFKNSLDIFTELGINRERASTLREWAKHEMQQQRRDTAGEYWRQARQIFEELGMEKEIERMEELAFNAP